MKNVASQGDLDDERLSEISLKTATTLRTLITTSAISSHSRNSLRKRQKLRDKPGSPQEREYLLTTLRALIERSIQLEPQIKDALLSVLTFNSKPFSGLGQNLSREFSRLVTAVKGWGVALYTGIIIQGDILLMLTQATDLLRVKQGCSLKLSHRNYIFQL